MFLDSSFVVEKNELKLLPGSVEKDNRVTGDRAGDLQTLIIEY